MESSGMVHSVQVDPEVPEGYWSCIPMEDRPKEHLAWLGKPFIQTVSNPHFPAGVRYDVYCLDGGTATDRPSVWGMFGSLDEAVQRAKEGPPWRKN